MEDIAANKVHGSISLEMVEYYISHPNCKEKIYEQMLEVRKDILELNDQNNSVVKDIVKTIQVGIHYDDTGGSSSGKKKDLGDILTITQKMIQEHREELFVKYKQLLNKSEHYHRLGLVYDTLDSSSKEILDRLYVKKEKWEYIEYDLDISHRKVLGIRKQALLDMLNRYNSDLTNYQLALQSTCDVVKKELKKREKRKDSPVLTGQMKLILDRKDIKA